MDSNTIVEEHLKRLLEETIAIVKETQNILTHYLLPDSDITKEAVISDILQVVDTPEVMALINEVGNDT